MDRYLLLKIGHGLRPGVRLEYRRCDDGKKERLRLDKMMLKLGQPISSLTIEGFLRPSVSSTYSIFIISDSPNLELDVTVGLKKLKVFNYGRLYFTSPTYVETDRCCSYRIEVKDCGCCFSSLAAFLMRDDGVIEVLGNDNSLYSDSRKAVFYVMIDRCEDCYVDIVNVSSIARAAVENGRAVVDLVPDEVLNDVCIDIVCKGLRERVGCLRSLAPGDSFAIVSRSEAAKMFELITT